MCNVDAAIWPFVGVESKGVTILGPRVRRVAVSADFPVSGLVAADERDLAKPFRALPSVPLRHDEPHRASMLERQGTAVVAVCKKHVSVEDHIERKVRRVARVRA